MKRMHIVLLIILLAGALIAAYFLIPGRRMKPSPPSGTLKPLSPAASATPGAAPSHATPADLVQREVAAFKGKSFASSSETAEYVADLLLHGLPDVTDQSTREQILRIVIRDILPTYMTSGEALAKFLEDVAAQGDFHLTGADIPPELLPLFLAIYDVLIRPESWPLFYEVNRQDPSTELRDIAQAIIETYKAQGRLDDAMNWLDEMISTLTQQPAGQTGPSREMPSALIAGLNEIKASLVAEAARHEGRIPPLSEEIADMEAQLQRTTFESPAQQADFLAQLGDLYKSDGQYAEALQHYKDALKLRTGDSVFYQRITNSQTEAARGLLTPQEQVTLAQSRTQLQQIGLALHIYAADNQGRFPASLEELAAKNPIVTERSLLTDPVTNQPYIYTPGLTAHDNPLQVVVRTQVANHLYTCLYVDGHVETFFQPE